MKRKIGILLLVILMIFVITSCGNKDEAIDDSTSSGNPSTEDKVSSPIEDLPEIGVNLWTYLCGSTHVGDTPIGIVIGIDEGGYLKEASYDNSEDIEYALSLLKDATISEETNEVYTDNYNYMKIYWSDDTYTSISLNRTNLEISKANTLHYYILENFDEFWKYSKSISMDVE